MDKISSRDAFHMYYKLVGKEPIPCTMEEVDFKNNSLARSEIGPWLVSTVFLGINHSFGGSEPVLFETMIFGDVDDEFQLRYHTYDEAMEGHERVCFMVQKVWSMKSTKISNEMLKLCDEGDEHES